MSFSLTSKPHYLSIDIDYWTDSEFGKFIWEFGRFLLERPKDIPITAVMNHQQLLWNVNRTNVQRLVNIDFHSDLVSSDVQELHCGSWVSYVHWRRWGEYIWVRPKKDPSMGSCNGENKWSEGTDWKKTTEVIRDPNYMHLRTLYRNCKGIGVCMSPAFVNQAMRAAFLMLIAENGIPYREGDPTEHISVPRRPPGATRRKFKLASG